MEENSKKEDEYNEKDTTSAIAAHISTLLLGVLGPLLIYASTDNEFAQDVSKRVIEGQIFLYLYITISIFAGLIFILPFLITMGLLSAFFIYPIIGVFRASKGDVWNYPLTPEFMSDTNDNQFYNVDKSQKNPYPQQNIKSKKHKNRKLDDFISPSKLKDKYVQGEITEEELERRLKSQNQYDDELELERN